MDLLFVTSYIDTNLLLESLDPFQLALQSPPPAAANCSSATRGSSQTGPTGLYRSVNKLQFIMHEPIMFLMLCFILRM